MFSQEFLRKCFSYDECTGLLRWLERPADTFKDQSRAKNINSRCSGKVAGTISKIGKIKKPYVIIRLNKVTIGAHVIAWVISKGAYDNSKYEIDHIDGNGTNNILSNLRLVTRKANSMNQRLRSNNKSGINGVYWHSKAKKWAASIKAGGITVHLGLFDSKIDAGEARKIADRKNGYHVNHGTDRPL